MDPKNARRRGGDTAGRILDSAERLVQARGFNGFSYADVAAELGVTKASLHYHSPGKDELGQALIAPLLASASPTALDAIEGRGAGRAGAPSRAYVALYTDVLRGERMCLCGMLAAEYATLSEAAVRAADRASSTTTRCGSSGCSSRARRRQPELRGPGAATARLIVSALEGAMLVARPYGDLERFTTAAGGLMATLTR